MPGTEECAHGRQESGLGLRQIAGDQSAGCPGLAARVRPDSIEQMVVSAADSVEITLPPHGGDGRVTIVHCFDDIPIERRGEARDFFADGWDFSLELLRRNILRIDENQRYRLSYLVPNASRMRTANISVIRTATLACSAMRSAPFPPRAARTGFSAEAAGSAAAARSSSNRLDLEV